MRPRSGAEHPLFCRRDEVTVGAELADDAGTYPRALDAVLDLVDELSRQDLDGTLAEVGLEPRLPVPPARHDDMRVEPPCEVEQRGRVLPMRGPFVSSTTPGAPV